MSKPPPPRIAVIGTGPIGIEAALYARACGLPVALYDRGGIADHIRRWGHVRLFTPFGMNTTPLGLKTLRAEKVLAPGRDRPPHRPRIPRRLSRPPGRIGSPAREPVPRNGGASNRPRLEPAPDFRLLVRDGKGVERIESADVVLDCTGNYATPKWLGEGTIAAVGELAARPQIASGLEDVLGERKNHYAGKSIVLVGDGYSAATTICSLAALAEEHPATWVFWLTRGPRGQPLPRLANDPFKERDRLAARANSLATRCDGNLEFHPQTLIDEVTHHGPDRGFRVAGRSNGKQVSWEVERVIANVGYRPDTKLAAALAPQRTRLLCPRRQERDTQVSSCATASSRSARVFAAIMGNPRLDLYAKKAA